MNPQSLFPRSTRLAAALMLAAAVITCAGCGDNSNQKFLSMGTAPIGGAFNPVGNALSQTLNENKGDNEWKVQAKGTKGSQENIRRLNEGTDQLALSNSAISYHAVRGTGSWKGKKYDIRTVVTIAPNVAMFITKKDSGIKTIADLIGKKVVCGPSGAGFEMFLEPLLKEHGVSFDDFDQKLNSNQNGAVDMLADGAADAAFLGGAVPTPAIQRACNEQEIYFIPFDEAAIERLAKLSYFQAITIPADKYKDLTEDYHGLNVGSMHLITSADQDEELIYQITKTLWENRQSIDHPAAKKFINRENAAFYTGTDFHPGAARFYKEINIWSAKSMAAKTTESE